jgi:septal ring factor EnvC (AmiA/AmiB activator)
VLFIAGAMLLGLLGAVVALVPLTGSTEHAVPAGARAPARAGGRRSLACLAGARPAIRDEDQQQKELERIRAQAAEKRRRAQELKVKEGKVLKELRATEARLRTTKTNIGALNKREQQLTKQLGDVRLELDRSRAALSDQRSKLSLRLRRLYMFGRARELEFFLSSNSFAELLTRWDFLTRVARQDRRILLGITRRRSKSSGTRSASTRPTPRSTRTSMRARRSSSASTSSPRRRSSRSPRSRASARSTRPPPPSSSGPPGASSAARRAREEAPRGRGGPPPRRDRRARPAR